MLKIEILQKHEVLDDLNPIFNNFINTPPQNVCFCSQAKITSNFIAKLEKSEKVEL
jgi:hypothetical protein